MKLCGLPHNWGGATWFDLCKRYPGTLSATGLTWGPTRYGYGLTFDGSSGTVTCTGLQLDKGCTISAWINPSNTSRGTIFGSTSFGNLAFKYNNGNLELETAFTSGIGTATAGVPTNAWSHVGATYDTSGNYAIYYNGVSVASGTNSVSVTTHDAVLGLNWFGERFTGGMADVSVWLSRILSAADFAELYKQSLSWYPTEITRNRLWSFSVGSTGNRRRRALICGRN
jgi:hypothetical protein